MTDKMKQLITVLLAVLPAFLALSCSLEQELSPDGGQAGRTIRIVTADTDTRTVMGEESDGKIPVYWSEGDRISVNGVTSSPLEASSGSSSAEFKVRNVEPPYTVIYPASAYAGTGDDGLVSVSIPSAQPYSPDSFGAGADILYGTSDEEDIVAVSHLCGTIRVRLTDDLSNTIRSLVLRSIGDDAPIAGMFTLDIASGELSAAGENMNEVSLEIPDEGVTLGAEDKDFYFTIPAGTYPEGFELRFEDERKHVLRLLWLREAEGAEPGVTVASGTLVSFASSEYEPDSREIVSAEDWEEFVSAYNSGADGWEEEWLGKDGAVRIGADFSAEKLSQIAEFSHILDGCGHTVTQTRAALPLVGTLRGTVRNLVLAGTMEAEDPNVQGAAVFASVIDGGEFSGCTSDTDIYVSGDAAKYVSAAFARTFRGGKITGCTNSGDIIVTVSLTQDRAVAVAGIVAMTSALASPAVISDCVNEGDISVMIDRGTAGSNVRPVNAGYAGIVSNVISGDAENFLTLEKCINYGDVSVSCTQDPTSFNSLMSGCGGIVGLCTTFTTTGAGYSDADGSGDNCRMELYDCVNYGDISNGLVSSDGSTGVHKAFSGGIAGVIAGTAGARSVMSGCESYCSVPGYQGAYSRSSLGTVYGGLLGMAADIDISGCTAVSPQVGNLMRQSFAASAGIGIAFRPFSMTGCRIYADISMIRSATYTENNYSLGFTLPTASEDGNTANAVLAGSSVTDCSFGGSISVNETPVTFSYTGTAFGTITRSDFTASSFAGYIHSLSYGAGEVVIDGNSWWDGQTE